jgi:hypothetical protein
MKMTGPMDEGGIGVRTERAMEPKRDAEDTAWPGGGGWGGSGA